MKIRSRRINQLTKAAQRNGPWAIEKLNPDEYLIHYWEQLEKGERVLKTGADDPVGM